MNGLRLPPEPELHSETRTLPRGETRGASRRQQADRSSPSPAKRIYSTCDINMQLDGCQRAKGRHSLIKTTSAAYGSPRSRGVQRQGDRRSSAIRSETSRRGRIKHFRDQCAGIVSAGLDRAAP
jgi:hypothetical protein